MYKDKLAEVQTIIDEIEEQIRETECVFRGEPECYEKVSCSAFREYTNVSDTFRPSKVPTDLPGLLVDTPGLEIHFNFTASKESIQGIQKEMLKNLQHHIGEVEDADFLSMTAILQHIGHGTHLLDFTKDYRIAMFFACRKEFNKDGRIILLRTGNEKYKFHNMSHRKELSLVKGRAEAQKSVLVDCPEFFVEETDCYSVHRIPKNLKVPFMEYLKEKSISEETMFPDYLGFIKKEEARKHSHKHFREGLEYENCEQYDAAIQCYDKAINLKYGFASAYKHRGYALFMKGELDKAEDDLTKSLYFDPADTHSFYNEVLSFVRTGFAHHYRSRVFARKGEKDKALRDSSKAIDIATNTPDIALSYFNHGQIHFIYGELEEAITYLSKGLEIEPYNSKALGLRGKVYWQQGSIEEAMDDFNKAIEMNTKDPEVFHLRGIGYASKRKLDDALEDLNKSLNINPDNPEVLKNRAKVYYQKGKIDKSIVDLKSAVKLNPNDAEASKLLTMVREKNDAQNQD